MAEAPAAEARLERRLGLAAAVAIGVSASLGTGAFAGLAIAVGRSQALWPLAILGAGLVALASGLSAGRLAAAHPTSGGTYEQASRLLNPALGRMAGWLFLAAKVASVAAAANVVAAGGLAAIGIDAPWTRRIAAAVLTLLATALVAGGLRRSTASIVVLLAASGASLLAFIVGIDSRGVPPTPAPTQETWLGMPEAIALAFVAFAGFGRVATLGEEVRRPERTIPAAIVASVAIVAGLAIAVFSTALSATTPGQLLAMLDETGSPLVAIAERQDRRWLSWALAVGGLAAMGGVILNLLLGMSRVVLAMSRRSDLPAAASSISNGSPRRAVALVGGAATLAALAGDFGWAWLLSTATILPYYAITNLAAIREPRSARWGRPVAAIGLLGTLAVACFLPVAGLVAGIGVGIAGLLLSAIFRRRAADR